MSRSRHKTPITGLTTAASDKAWKEKASRRLRKTARQKLVQTLDGDALPEKRWAVVNPWDAPKDGKFWHGFMNPKLERK
jgi:hypothetical protein